jgi:hypothetical protein
MMGPGNNSQIFETMHIKRFELQQFEKPLARDFQTLVQHLLNQIVS